MKETTEYVTRTINYRVIHPLLLQPLFDRFELLVPKLWPKCTMMFHVGRSGSTVLGNLLGQSEEIFWDGEIYHPFLKYLKQLTKQGWNPQTDKLPLEPNKVLRNRMALGKILYVNKTIYGCESKFYHLKRMNITIQRYLEDLESLGFKYFIILERKNYLRTIISSLISNRKLKKFHLTSEIKPHLNQIRVDVDNFKTDGERKPLIKFLQDHRDDFQNLENLLRDRRVLKLTYEEDISENPQIAMRRVCEFLDTEYREGKIQYRKTNPFPLKDIIINYDEVKQALKGTPFEWMTDN
jgi:hypothetical protein